MPLAPLFYIPRTQHEWNVWSFVNQDSHNRIAAATFTQKQQFLTVLVLDPIPRHDLSGWLRNHQQMHNEMDDIWNVDGTDLTVPDPSDEAAYADFIYRHAREHQQVENAAGIG